MENNLYENGTEVLIFNYIPEWKKEQDFYHFIRGKIIKSEISNDLSYHGSSWNITNYTVLGEDGKEYFGNYKNPHLGDSFFLTEEDYVLFLKRKIAINEDKIQNIRNDNRKIYELINEIELKENHETNVKLVSVFATKEQEELFAKCAKETIFEQINGNKNIVRKR